ncbi:sugar ABC transporter substrate-binding protein [Nocardia callitridis]|uniref:Sugar ABC transporter substrate-binding protein n=1 Tax=Nocardia callitridis TaxID=648753 RepID=A0ABP9KK62_9NOCA
MVLAIVVAAVVLVAAALWSGRDPDSTASGRTVVGLRVWDESFVPRYRASLDEFERANPDVRVRITVVPWSSYEQKLRLDLAGGTADDLFWSSSYAEYADAGRLLEIDESLGPRRAWDPASVAQYTRAGKLWAVPQFVDGGTAVYYNRDLLAAAGIDPASLNSLRWGPGADDSLTPLLRRLAAVAPSAYNAGHDFQSVELPYLGSAGARFRDGQGDFVFDSTEAISAFEYLVGLIRDGLAPSPADTNTDSDFAKNAFLQGKLAMFQSGTFNLAQIAEQAEFGWGVAMLPEGPAGRVSTNSAIGVAGNTDTEHPEATRRVLRWLGSAEGTHDLVANGATISANVGQQAEYRDYWSDHGIDVTPFFDVLHGPKISSGTAPGLNSALRAIDPIFGEMYAGRLPVPEALPRARAAAEDAVQK